MATGTGNGDAQSGVRTAWMVGVVLVVVVAIVGAWMALSVARVDPRPTSKPGADAPLVPGKTYRAAQHMDPASARLSPAEEGKAWLDFVLKDVADGEHLRLSFREGLDPKEMRVFVQKGDTTTIIGNLTATTAGTGRAGETALHVALPRLPERVLLIDLRWDEGRWEGFEVAAPAGGKPR